MGMGGFARLWLDVDLFSASLRDKLGRARIVARIRSAEYGNFGDCEPVGEGVFEMRIHTGPGYRVYFTRRNSITYLLLLGGDKSSQKRDISRAQELARALYTGYAMHAIAGNGSAREVLNKSTSGQRQANPPTSIRQRGFGE